MTIVTFVFATLKDIKLLIVIIATIPNSSLININNVPLINVKFPKEKSEYTFKLLFKASNPVIDPTYNRQSIYLLKSVKI